MQSLTSQSRLFALAMTLLAITAPAQCPHPQPLPQGVCDFSYVLRSFGCDYGHLNVFRLQRDGSPVCGSANCPWPGNCWNTVGRSCSGSGGGISSWFVSSNGSLSLSHNKDVQVYGATNLFSEFGGVITVPVSGDVISVWMNGNVFHNSGTHSMVLNPGWNTFEFTSYNQNQNTSLSIGALLPQADLMSSFACQTAKAQWTPYGTACAGSTNQVPTIGHVGLPISGSTFSIAVDFAQPTTPALLMTGFDDYAYQGRILPLDLSPWRAPGCFLLVDIAFSRVYITDGSGSTAASINIPLSANLLGQDVFHQWASLDLPANPLGLVFSRGSRSTIGNY